MFNRLFSIKVGSLKQLLAFLILFVGLELIIFNRDFLFWIIIVQSILLVLFVLWVINFRLFNLNSFGRLIIPLLYFVGTISFLLFIPSKYLSHIYPDSQNKYNHYWLRYILFAV